MKRAFFLACAFGCVPTVQSGVNPVVACVADSDCQAHFVCQAGGCQANPRTCAANADCLLGESCQPNPLCAPNDGGRICPAPYICSSTNGGYCAPCRTSADCESGAFCVALNSGSLVCGPACTADCPSASSCSTFTVPDGGTVQLCLPTSGTCP